MPAPLARLHRAGLPRSCQPVFGPARLRLLIPHPIIRLSPSRARSPSQALLPCSVAHEPDHGAGAIAVIVCDDVDPSQPLRLCHGKSRTPAVFFSSELVRAGKSTALSPRPSPRMLALKSQRHGPRHQMGPSPTPPHRLITGWWPREIRSAKVGRRRTSLQKRLLLAVFRAGDLPRRRA